MAKTLFQNHNQNHHHHHDAFVAEGCGSCNIIGGGDVGGCTINSCGVNGSSSSGSRKKRSNNHATSELLTDADLAKEMNELSVKERQQVLEELHGVHELPYDETKPEFLSQKFNEFDIALKKISKAKRNKLDKAIFMRPSYLTSNKFKLMFLRADIYDPIAASIRMCKFFDWKSKLYGDDKLGRDITLEDLDAKTLEVAVLSGGCLQLPKKDPTGRPITFFDASKIDTNYHIEMLRFSFYLIMSIVTDDEICQKKGLTNITSYMTSKRQNNIPITKVTDDLRSSGDMMASLPIRITGYHYITDNPALQFLLTMIRIALGKQVRLRLRTHLGSAIELKYSLLTFGIDCDNLLNSHEQGKTKLHDEYLERRRGIESQQAMKRLQQETSTNLVEFPSPNDVLIGRGRPYHEFAGTRRLIKIIDTQLQHYYKMDNNLEDSRFWKTCINIQMVKDVKDANGRFLQRLSSPPPNQQQQGGWKILNDQQSREKTANLFRYRYNIINNPRNSKATTTSSLSSSNAKTKQQQIMMVPSSSSGGGGGGGGGAQKRLREEVNHSNNVFIGGGGGGNDGDLLLSFDNNDNSNMDNYYVHCNTINNNADGTTTTTMSNKRPASASPTADTPTPFSFWNSFGSSSSSSGGGGGGGGGMNNNNNNNHGNSIFQILSSQQPSSSSRM